MSSLEIAFSNMASPAILFFILGVIAASVKSDLEIPDSIGSAITLYILVSIGIKGGVSVSKTGIEGLIIYVLAAVVIGIIITTLVYIIMSKIGFDASNAGSIAGHYGACSSVTLTSTLVFLQQIGANFEEFVPALYPFMDTAALITAIILGYTDLKKKSTETDKSEYAIKDILRISITAKSTLLIFGGFLIGLISGVEGTKSLMPFYENLFKGVFTVFMLDIGLLTGSRLYELKNVRPITFLLAIILPPIHAIIAITIATFIGLSPGGATIFAALAGGASYITAPAVMRDTFPDANPSLALAIALGIVFPFNIILGIPFYYHVATIISQFIK